MGEDREIGKPLFKEVFKTLSDFNGDKALGLYGFPTGFWQFAWEIVKRDVMAMFLEFHGRGHFVRSLEATFLVQILKKEGGLYKWFAKVLANRMTSIPKVISRA